LSLISRATTSRNIGFILRLQLAGLSVYGVILKFAISPLPLLLITGTLVGATFPLGKLAGAAGIAPLVWAFLISAGSALVLAVGLEVQRQALPVSLKHVRYYAVAGVVSYAVPNVLVFVVIPKLGAGFTSIMFTFSPIITLLLSSLLRTRVPTALGMAGIGCGFVGALMIVLSKGQVGQPAEPLWLGVAFLIPLALATGNVYRTLDWPAEASGLALAVGTNAASALFLLGASLAALGGLPLNAAMAAPGLVLAQVVSSAAMFSVFFRLQRIGGPVYLSQIGYVAAAVGLGVGTWLMGEQYGLLTWAGALVVAVGVAMTTLAQRTT
jgi:drug/metabolite transporter (DMT)-like permease